MADEPHRDLRARCGGSAQLERLENAAPPQADEPPAVDAWLERRLRVFERALALLEARQEKTEQELKRRLALLEEIVFPRGGDAAKKETDGLQPDLLAAFAPPEPANADPELRDLQKDMRGFVAEARKLAKVAVIPPPPKPKGAPRWIAWSAVGCAGAMVMTGLALGTVAGASVAPAGGVTHRQISHNALARTIALADSGDARGQAMLAFDYLRSQPVDHAAAARWALAAANQGEPMAQNLLGAFYQSGDGISPDPRQAFAWFEAAALRGNVKAMHNLAVAYAEGQGIARDPERAAAWFNRAAMQGYTDSQFDLAVLYERGDGVAQNPLSALKWYLIAARSGDKEADARATQLAAEMSMADVAEAQSLAANFAPITADIAANTL